MTAWLRRGERNWPLRKDDTALSRSVPSFIHVQLKTSDVAGAKAQKDAFRFQIWILMLLKFKPEIKLQLAKFPQTNYKKHIPRPSRKTRNWLLSGWLLAWRPCNCQGPRNCSKWRRNSSWYSFGRLEGGGWYVSWVWYMPRIYFKIRSDALEFLFVLLWVINPTMKFLLWFS